MSAAPFKRPGKFLYQKADVRANLVEEALPDTIEFLLVQIENYITGEE